ncbi:sugar phosphate isomerase/epimerase family protein [Brenneria tiliae]|uniref:Sugar phosphate isomerase/epimerase n=1 Tax=Brenneria tiliae TaxID=2914984 RepID=A0ABT0MZT3_9GAMM|nr:TIM barrel protein [Brenneria tiliae]MCL2895057.1 sugar phosphate isomerase/epimerase [Brenneria tiliae]
MGIKTAVSLYSLQDEYMNKKMSLEDMLQYLQENKVEGFEIIPDQMLPNSPHLSEETLQRWHALVNKYNVKPVCADVFLNSNLYKNRTLTKIECVNLLIDEIKMANRLGIKLIRLVSMVPGFVIEPLLPYAEKYDVQFALEIHAGMSFDNPSTQGFIKEMRRVDSPYVGLVIDAGIFCRRIPRVFNEYNEKVLGVNPAIIDYFNRFFDKGLDGRSAFEGKKQMKPELAALVTEKDIPYVMIADGYENAPFTIMDEYFKYIKHFHFKLWEMNDGAEYSIDYYGLLKYLHDKGYEGYGATEYEGNRWVLPGNPIEEKEQVAAHQEMLRRHIKEIEG